ncbi:MAG: hypothetical protein GY953_58000 [bacterium]|nr:hypothetical protein [bacterium]
MSVKSALPIAVAIVVITAFGYFLFPGHTYLQQDCQIYVPILERLHDDSVLAEDPVAVRHHVTFTVYDEWLLLARSVTGLEFEPLLVADQLVFRALGILGVFLMATALGLSRPLALLVAAVYALGANVPGPEVLTVEYEPKPRSSAFPAVFLAIGLIAHRRHLLGGIAASVAFLYHPPTASFFWCVAFLLILQPTRPEVMKRRLWALLPLAAAVGAMWFLSRHQAGALEPQPFLATIDAELEQLQLARAKYAWVSTWFARWGIHYLILWVIGLAAALRLRRYAHQRLFVFLVGLPAVGVLSVPVTYLLLDRWKWALVPKFQPARALLFAVAFAVILSAAACLHAAASKRIPEALGWGLLAFGVTLARPYHLLFDVTDPLRRQRLIVAVSLGVLLALAGWLFARYRVAGWAVWCIALLAPFAAIPHFGQVVNYTELDHPELAELSGWARENTPRSAVFLFPDAAKARHPGVFRARALRAVYVDWKGGGQVNMVKSFAKQWWRRWQDAVVPGFSPKLALQYRALGIDYFVVGPANRLEDQAPLFENSRYLVYRAR